MNELNPEYFGENSYTRQAHAVNPKPRIYFFVKSDQQDTKVKIDGYLYQSRLHLEDLYPVELDPLNFGESLYGSPYRDNQISQEYMDLVEKNGFIGLIYPQDGADLRTLIATVFRKVVVDPIGYRGES